ncbi:MAG TPA: hypothetical protein VN888_26860 [Mycobacterium sp.]|nr:hypothetical protein [Mycobacterium sp.]
MRMPQSDCGNEHQPVHDQVDLGGHRGEYPVRAVDSRDHRIEEADDSYHDALCDEDVQRDALIVDLLEVRGKVTLFASDLEQALGRAVKPGDHSAESPNRQRERDHGQREPEMEVREQGIEGLHHPGGEADRLRGDYP